MDSVNYLILLILIPYQVNSLPSGECPPGWVDGSSGKGSSVIEKKVGNFLDELDNFRQQRLMFVEMKTFYPP